MVFSQSVYVRRMIEEIALADAAALEWCKVFGSWVEDTHRTPAVPKDKHDASAWICLMSFGTSLTQILSVAFRLRLIVGPERLRKT
jgi:hypothetical protein